MPTTIDESNPFEELLDHSMPPALPPVAGQEFHHQQQQPYQEYHEQQQYQQPPQEEAFAAADADLSTTTMQQQQIQPTAANMMMQEPQPKLERSFKTSLLLKSDLTKSGRDSHPCGIIHFTRTSSVGGDEHAFAWITYQTNPDHVASTLGHMQKFGFDPNQATFIPYSSRRAWVEKYPMAFPHVHCSENGVVSGFPYWSEGGPTNNDIAGGRMSMMAAASVGGVAPATSQQPSNTPARGRKKRKIVPTAHLPNDERDELHVQIYKYFQWLQNSLLGASGGGVNGDKKHAALCSASGINAESLNNLINTLPSTFRAVKTAERRGAAVDMPFLEEGLSEPLANLAAQSKRDPVARMHRNANKRSRGLDFDEMYNRLVEFQQQNGHTIVPQKYAADPQLGSWVANMRSKRKQLNDKGEAYEGEHEEIGFEGDNIDENGETKKRSGTGRQRLTQERILSLDALGFQWVVAKPNHKSWEERFEDLKDYQQQHGSTRVPRSSGTLGEWVHMQRRLYNKKDPNFMVKKMGLLDDIGFEWHPRKHAMVSWEDNFNRLQEYGNMNGHYNVRSPFPESQTFFENESAELVEQHRFAKWVKRIHSEYRLHISNNGSRMLNDIRVQQLQGIGFSFIV